MFSALVSAFAPRPGRTNVPQIQDFEVTPPGTEDTPPFVGNIAPSRPKGVKLTLTIRVGF